ncbi:xanthine dehydrogenase [Arenicella chitinivorans]|uniref:Xanthine dehydrogenase n=1 Tax=Arenicella chitinivorans TaxID=1329800 RepID=A0A918RJS5_9GAMM|nr:molybdopterin cofactor-binding domain-containing protein [Arenicella chitinivorans]GHA01503.1 xanthine dehydrogenase [Arenicella chitinivorans]
MSHFNKLSRREFLSLTGRAGGVLMLSTTPSAPIFAANGDAVATPPESAHHQLGAFVSIDQSGKVDIICHRAEMGQGILTSVPQLIADELEASWDQVNAVLGKADPAYGNQSTGGSASIRRFITQIRQMGAVARVMLEQAAADRWQVDVANVKANNHQVHNMMNGATFGFGELAADATKRPIPKADKLVLKSTSEFKIVGKDVPLQGLRKIVTGQATYAQDLQLPGMLIASIERPPVVGGKVKTLDASDAKSVRGVVDVIQLKQRRFPVNVNPVSGVAVLATNTWAAIEGRKRLKISWEDGDNGAHDSETYKQLLIDKVKNQGKAVRSEGKNLYQHEFDPQRTVEACYTFPYHHHMSMETPAATAMINQDGSCTVWSGTQTPQWGKGLVLEELGLDPTKDADKVTLHNTLMGGAFGRKGKNDFTLEAVELAKASGKPVKVIWSREDDVKHGFYHAIAANYFKAELTTDGGCEHWLQRVASPPIAWIFDDSAQHLDATSLSLGFADVPFDIPHMQFENPGVDTHVRIGWLRAVGNINNAFGLGCFVDELATKAGVSTHSMWLKLLGKDRLFDPRLEGFKDYTHYGNESADHLLDIARFKAVLNEVVSKSKADQTLPSGQGWGISLAASFNSYAAAATKVEVRDGKVTVLEMHTAIDCGLVVTPDRVVSQMEGAMIMALSMTLESEITVKDGKIVQNNFYDYPVTRINKTPPLHVHILPSDKAPGGVGEPGLPPICPSIVNAIFHASGTRIRDLPVKKTLQV